MAILIVCAAIVIGACLSFIFVRGAWPFVLLCALLVASPLLLLRTPSSDGLIAKADVGNGESQMVPQKYEAGFRGDKDGSPTDAELRDAYLLAYKKTRSEYESLREEQDKTLEDIADKTRSIETMRADHERLLAKKIADAERLDGELDRVKRELLKTQRDNDMLLAANKNLKTNYDNLMARSAAPQSRGAATQQTVGYCCDLQQQPICY